MQADVQFEVFLIITDEAAVVLSDFEGVDGVAGDERGSFFGSDAFVVSAEDEGFFGDAGFEWAFGISGDGGGNGKGFSVAAGGEVEVFAFDEEGPARGGTTLCGDHSLGGEFFELGGDGEGAVGDGG